MAKDKTSGAESNATNKKKKDTRQNEKGHSDNKQKEKVPNVDLPKKEKNPKKEEKEKQRQQYKNSKDSVKRRNAQVEDLEKQLNGINKKIERKGEEIDHAYAQAESLRRQARESKEGPEKTRQLLEQSEAYYNKARAWESDKRKAKEEAEIIKSRIDTAKYANIQSRRSFLEAMRGLPHGALGFLRTIWEKTIFYKIYQNISSAILDGQTKQSQKTMLDQYDDIRKNQRIAQEITRATKDVSREVEECLNRDETSEMEKIEELARLCGKSKATIVAQLNDKETLQFKFIPAIDSQKKGVIEISTREILQDADGRIALGKEELKNAINYDKNAQSPLLNLSEERRTALKLGIYGMLNPDGHNALLQVADPDIAKAVREELDRNVALAHEWDPKKERIDAEIAAKATAARVEEEAIKKRQQELAKEQELSTKEGQNKTAEPKKYEHLPDFIYGRIDLNAMTTEEKTHLQKDLSNQIKAAEKDFEAADKQEVLPAKGVVSKLRTQEILCANNKLYDKKNGNEIAINLSNKIVPLTINVIKSDEFIAKAYENIQEQAQKNKDQINNLLAGKFPDGKDPESTIAKTLRAEILRADDSRSSSAEANPVIVNSKRELVEKIMNREVVFAEDLNRQSEPAKVEADKTNETIENTQDDKTAAPVKSANSEKQNRILVDRETGAQLVYLKDQTMQTWTEHDFSEKSFIRSVQRESEELSNAQKEAQNQAKEAAQEQTTEAVKENTEVEKNAPEQQDSQQKDSPINEEQEQLQTAGHAADGKVPEQSSDEQSQKVAAAEEEKDCPSLSEMSQEQMSDKELQSIKDHYYTINTDGYLMDDLGDKIYNKDGEPYCLSDFAKNPKAYQYFQDQYAQTYGHEYSTDEMVIDPKQEEIYSQTQEENASYVNDDRDEELEFDYSGLQGCDTVMNAGSFHNHSPQYENPLEIDNNYNGIPDIDEH